MEIKRNEESDLRVGFDDIFKAHNNILSVVSRANGMIGCMVKNSISREPNVILKIDKP